MLQFILVVALVAWIELLCPDYLAVPPAPEDESTLRAPDGRGGMACLLGPSANKDSADAVCMLFWCCGEQVITAEWSKTQRAPPP